MNDPLAAALRGRRDLTDEELWRWQSALEDARDERQALYARLDRAEATLAAIRAFAVSLKGARHWTADELFALLDAAPKETP